MRTVNRKEIVQALEEKWGVKAKYLGAPTFAYEVGGYCVDRNGTVTGKDNGDGIPAFEELQMTEGEELGLGKQRHEDFQGENGMRADDCSETVEDQASAEQAEMQVDGYAVEFPLADHKGASLRNLVNMLSSKQKLLISAFDLPHLFMDNRFAEELSHKETDSIETFQESLLALGPDRCPGIEFDFEKRTMALKLAKADPSFDEMAAFRDLAVCINQNAQKLKNASFRPSQEENPKFALRTWLTRIGMNGDKFKMTRKVLLANLAGNAAFRSEPGLSDFLDAYHGGGNAGDSEGGA